MAQMTDDMAKHIVANYEASQSRYPLTAWEICQLAKRWLATRNYTPPPEQPAIDQGRWMVVEAWEHGGRTAELKLQRSVREGDDTLALSGQYVSIAIIDGAKAGHEIAPDTAQAASALWEVMDTLARDNYQREYAALNKVRLYLASLTAAKAGRTEGEES